MRKQLYSHYPNGDFNERIESVEDVEWELNEGGNGYAIVTSEPISQKRYNELFRNPKAVEYD